MASSEGIQAHHLIPQEVARIFGKLFREELPGWALNGEYNYKAGGGTQKATGQYGYAFRWA